MESQSPDWLGAGSPAIWPAGEENGFATETGWIPRLCEMRFGIGNTIAAVKRDTNADCMTQGVARIAASRRQSPSVA
jgi:hypothetical protein